MSSYVIDGVTLPDPVAGQPALDFCNTRAGWNAEQPKEYLVDPGVLTVWAGEAGLLPIEDALRLRKAAPEPGLLLRALRLREALYPVLLGRGTVDDWSVVSEEAAAARGQARLVPGEPAAHWEPGWVGPETALHAVAVAAADFLTGPRAGTVGACPGEGCGWLFSDPRGRRRWCSMAVCGNRAKARRFREGQ